MSTGEGLGRIRKAAIHCRAPDIDEFGIGQDSTNEKYVVPVVRKLVDKQRSIGLAVELRAPHVILAKSLSLLLGHLHQRARYGDLRSEERSGGKGCGRKF